MEKKNEIVFFISAGYRVKSKRGVEFRRWANLL